MKRETTKKSELARLNAANDKARNAWRATIETAAPKSEQKAAERSWNATYRAWIACRWSGKIETGEKVLKNVMEKMITAAKNLIRAGSQVTVADLAAKKAIVEALDLQAAKAYKRRLAAENKYVLTQRAWNAAFQAWEKEMEKVERGGNETKNTDSDTRARMPGLRRQR